MNVCETSLSRTAVTQSVGTHMQNLSPLREMFRNLRCGIGKILEYCFCSLNPYKYLQIQICSLFGCKAKLNNVGLIKLGSTVTVLLENSRE